MRNDHTTPEIAIDAPQEWEAELDRLEAEGRQPAGDSRLLVLWNIRLMARLIADHADRARTAKSNRDRVAFADSVTRLTHALRQLRKQARAESGTNGVPSKVEIHGWDPEPHAMNRTVDGLAPNAAPMPDSVKPK